MDLIMGSFADTHARSLTEAEVLAFEGLLEEADQDVYDWILGRSPAPAIHETVLLARVRAFAAAGVTPS
jgi:antitoxin CptB